MKTIREISMPCCLEQLLCFMNGPIWDGNLISKTARDTLVGAGLIIRGAKGFQFLSSKGVEWLTILGYLNEESWQHFSFQVSDKESR